MRMKQDEKSVKNKESAQLIQTATFMNTRSDAYTQCHFVNGRHRARQRGHYCLKTEGVADRYAKKMAWGEHWWVTAF